MFVLYSSFVSCDTCVICFLDLMGFCLLFPHQQGTPERLIMHLVEEPSVVDPTYIEDFLLTYRTFLSNPMDVGKKLFEWFQMDNLRDTVSLCAFAVVFGSGVFTELRTMTKKIWRVCANSSRRVPEILYASCINANVLYLCRTIKKIMCCSGDQYKFSQLSCA